MSRAVKNNEEEEEAIYESEFAPIHNWEKLRLQRRHSPHIKHEVSYRHLAAREKRRNTRKQAKGNQKSADELNNSCDKGQPIHSVTATGKAEKLLPAMTCIRQTSNQAHDAVNWVGKSIQGVHGPRLMRSIFRVKPMALTVAWSLQFVTATKIDMPANRRISNGIHAGVVLSSGIQTLRRRHFLCQLAITKTQETRSRIHFSSSKFDNSMKSRNSAASCSTALIVLAIFFMNGMALAQSSDWKAPPTAVNRPNPVPVNPTTIAMGQKLYVGNCMMCHGQSGKGDGPGGAALEKKPADLGARIRSGETDGELFWKISEGRSPMISWKGSLSETQRWALVVYIKSLAGK